MLHKNIPYRRRAERKYKKKLEFLYERIPYFPSGANLVERDGKRFYRRFYRGSASSYLKRQSARKNRRRLGMVVDDEDTSISKRSFYRKVFDYWWELY